jgi:hypothetical protein
MIPVLENDDNINKVNGTLNAVGPINKMPQAGVDYTYSKELVGDFADSTTGKFGTASIEGSNVRYEMTQMGMKGPDKFAYAAQVTEPSWAGYYYETVTVIPATSIYYEDNFVSYSSYEYNATTKDWDMIKQSNAPYCWNAEEATDGVQSADRPGSENIYGYDDAYKNCATYSMGSANKVTVGSSNGPNNRETTAEADFAF